MAAGWENPRRSEVEEASPSADACAGAHARNLPNTRA
jgi:hypothetical protein